MWYAEFGLTIQARAGLRAFTQVEYMRRYIDWSRRALGRRLPTFELVVAFAMAAALFAPSTLRAQDAQPPGSVDGGQVRSSALRVFIDCTSRRCDREQFRQEIEFVNWVREPEDAQVYILMTDERSGAGGFRYTFDFEGRGALAGMSDQLRHTSSVSDVDDEVRESLRRTLALGLVRYVAQAGLAANVDVLAVSAVGGGARPLQAGSDDASPQSDPWDFWVFNVNGNAAISEQDTRSSKQYGFSLNANRTTEDWKLNFRTSGNFRRDDFELADTTIENNQDNFDASVFAVKSLGEHWGVGAEIEADNSTRLNRDLLIALGTGIEYNFFPFSESNRHIFLARYVVSGERVNYADTTIFGILEETVYRHELAVEYEERGPWGNVNLNAGVSQFLDRTDFYSVQVGGFARYRLFRGFSINVSGQYEVVRDQIFLPVQELSDEDILLGRVTLPTDSEFTIRVGFGYSFGSIFNNAVNTRFRRGVR